MTPSRTTLSPLDVRHGPGAELLLRVSIIAMEGRADGVGASELRRLLGHPGHALDRMDARAFARMVEEGGPYLGTALMIARDPRLARRKAAALRAAVERVRVERGLPSMLRIGG